jgi:phosphoribosylformylglycinamidine cyclo-ligase
MDYKSAGVDIEAGNRAVSAFRDAVRATYTPAVLAGVGAFGGLFDASALRGLERPVLVASTDGVGTKTRLAARTGRFEGVGEDIVNHCVNDILVQGARPLFFLDYVATPRLDPAMVAAVVTGAARACRAAGCALLGGETAEMPGVYADGEFDVVGTVVGVVDHGDIVDGARLEPGDAIIGLESSGLHTNGFSLARRILEGQDLSEPVPGDGRTWADALLAPHRSYLGALDALDGAGVRPRAFAHITGGGLIENPPRVFPDGVGAVLFENSWPVPPLFRELVARGGVDRLEAYRAFNMGLWMLVFVAPDDAERATLALDAAGLRPHRVGEAVSGRGVEFA